MSLDYRAATPAPGISRQAKRLSYRADMKCLRNGRVLFFQQGDLAQAGCGFQCDASWPAVLDMFGDQAWIAGAALGTGKVVQHQFFDYREGHGCFPLCGVRSLAVREVPTGYRPRGE